MNKQEYLINALAEEALEIAHAALKANRFGLDDHHPKEEKTNRQCISHEVADLMGVLRILREEGILPTVCEEELERLIEVKKRKVSKFMLVSERLGTLETSHSPAYLISKGDRVFIASTEDPACEFLSKVIAADSTSFCIDTGVWFYRDSLEAYTGTYKVISALLPLE